MKISYLALEAARNGQASYTHIHEIMRGLERRGCDVTLYQPSYAQKEKSPGLFLRLIHFILVQINLWARYRKGTVIYIRAHYMAFPTALIASAFGIPIIHEVNGPYEDTFVTHSVLEKVKPVLIWMQRTQYRIATRLIGVTENIAVWLQTESRRDNIVHVIPNGANTDIFRSGIPKPAQTPLKYAIFFGGLSRWHGIPDILKAFESPQWPADTDLLVIGDGAERKTVEEHAASNPRIHYMGRMDYTNIPQYVASALCSLVPITNPQGRSETGLYPLKLFESLACGVPVIVTNFPGQADLAKAGDCGIIIKDEEPDQIAEAVMRLAGNPEDAKAMGARGEIFIRDHHSWDKRAEDTHKLLLGILSDRAARS